MREEIDRRVDEFRREAEKLIAQRSGRAAKTSSSKPRSGEEPHSGLEAVGEGLEEVFEDLETTLNELSEMTEEKIQEHPFAAMAAAFAIGLLIGRLTKSQE